LGEAVERLARARQNEMCRPSAARFYILFQRLALSITAAFGLICAASSDSKGKPVGSCNAAAAERLQNEPHIVAFQAASTTFRAAYRLLVQPQ
jgi:hypothetical protein